MTVELRPHQRPAVEALANGKVLVGGVGTGKTITSLFYYVEKVLGGSVGHLETYSWDVPVYVFTTAKKRDTLDWQAVAASMGIGDLITVDSYNNIQKYKEVSNAFIILDEQRMVGSGAWTKTFLKLARSNRWIMLSATPGDVWEDYIPLFIANGFYKNRTEFKRRHIVYNNYGPYPKVDHYVETGRLVRLRNSILVKMPYERHTKRHIHTVPVGHDPELLRRVMKERWNIYEDRPLATASELFSVMRKVVYSHNTRASALRELMETHPRLIVFYNFNYELEMLRELLYPMCVSGGESDTSTTGWNSTTLKVSESSGCVPAVGKPGSPNQLSDTSRSGKATELLGNLLEGSDQTLQSSMSGTSGVRTPSDPSTQPGSRASRNERQNTKNSSTITDNPLKLTETCQSSVSIAEWNGHKHEPVPTTDRWVYLVQYVAGAEAWECTDTDAMVFFSLTYSYKNFEQAQGRIDRLNTPFTDLHYYVLMSKTPIDFAVARSLREKQDFNEKDFVGSF